jgi:uncharacterized membrane-anchored protein YitT (DUF2179 family)
MLPKIKRIKRMIASSSLVVIGCSISAIAYSLFLIPHHFVPGGIAGVSIILNYFLKVPVGVMIFVLNIPIIILAFKVMGRRYALRTLAGIVLSSFLIDFFHEVLRVPSATENPILASIYGGVMLGVGLGLVFRGHATTGGSDVVGMILSKTTGMSIGFGILITDFIIISASGLAYRNLEAPLYGYIVLFLSTRVIDMVLEGWNYSKLVYITSTQTQAIADFILKDLNRGGSAIRARSLYLNREGEVIMTVIHRKQLPELRQFIKDTDPEAFVIINDTYDVLGRGFKSKVAA